MKFNVLIVVSAALLAIAAPQSSSFKGVSVPLYRRDAASFSTSAGIEAEKEAVAAYASNLRFLPHLIYFGAHEQKICP